MLVVQPVKLEFSDRYDGWLEAPNGKIRLGETEGAFLPYNMVLGSLGACFYMTFLSIVEKKRLTFSGSTLEITGKKREEVPQTLESVHIQMQIRNASDQKQFLRSVELGAKYCSVHETISKVADIKIDVEFLDQK